MPGFVWISSMAPGLGPGDLPLAVSCSSGTNHLDLDPSLEGHRGMGPLHKPVDDHLAGSCRQSKHLGFRLVGGWVDTGSILGCLTPGPRARMALFGARLIS